MLGDKISAEFSKGTNAVILERHGVVIGAPTLFEAFRSFEALCACSLIRRNAKAIGGTLRSVSEEDVFKISEKNVCGMREYTLDVHTSEELDARRELCKFIGRAYDKQFILSGNGTFSCRLSDGSVLITPNGMDRQSLREDDLVLIANGKREAGKIPSVTLKRHLAIYENNPEVKSVIEAVPTCSMAYAVTDRTMDLRVLPETYISLRDVRKYPLLSDEKEIARDITVKTPLAVIENECIIAVGTSLLGAFDKLEMMENSAKIFRDALIFGEKPLGISAEAFGELERAFNL
jgi:L-fuculose-phosphate aldolase